MVDEDRKADESSHWLAYELHDGLMQWLVSAKHNAEALLPRDASLPDADNRNVDGVLRCLENALEEGRELIGFLESQRSANVDFHQALTGFIERLTRSGGAPAPEVELRAANPSWPELSPPVAWNLLRIAEQALANAFRHAGKCRVVVICDWQDESTLKLSVSDDGHGFDVEQSRSDLRFGLTGMQHRARLIGADYSIESQPGKGTCIHVALPL